MVFLQYEGLKRGDTTVWLHAAVFDMEMVGFILFIFVELVILLGSGIFPL